MKEAKYYIKLEDNNEVKCILCPHNCVIKPENSGVCKQRENHDGILYTTNYGHISSYGNDPIEKKPIAYFNPGTKVFSIGSTGCNLSCDFCQNFSISKEIPPTINVKPEDIIKTAIKNKSDGIAFTYNEPTVWYEYMYDIAVLAKEKDLYTVMVTNGYINEAPLIELLRLIDVFNVDLKAFNNNFYNSLCCGSLEPVLNTIKTISREKHIEVTTLVVENENDDLEELEELFKWLGNVNKNIPIHISRYFPRYKLTNPPTKIETLYKSSEIAKKYLKYVNLGNI